MAAFTTATSNGAVSLYIEFRRNATFPEICSRFRKRITKKKTVSPHGATKDEVRESRDVDWSLTEKAISIPVHTVRI